MRDRRAARISDLMRDLIARFLEEESDRTAVVTLTRVELLEEGKLVRSYISVFPQDKETAALGFVQRRTGALRDFVGKETKIKFVPTFEFRIDEGEKNRQRIDELLRK